MEPFLEPWLSDRGSGCMQDDILNSWHPELIPNSVAIDWGGWFYGIGNDDGRIQQNWGVGKAVKTFSVAPIKLNWIAAFLLVVLINAEIEPPDTLLERHKSKIRKSKSKFWCQNAVVWVTVLLNVPYFAWENKHDAQLLHINIKRIYNFYQFVKNLRIIHDLYLPVVCLTTLAFFSSLYYPTALFSNLRGVSYVPFIDCCSLISGTVVHFVQVSHLINSSL